MGPVYSFEEAICSKSQALGPEAVPSRKIGNHALFNGYRGYLSLVCDTCALWVIMQETRDTDRYMPKSFF